MFDHGCDALGTHLLAMMASSALAIGTPWKVIHPSVHKFTPSGGVNSTLSVVTGAMKPILYPLYVLYNPIRSL